MMKKILAAIVLAANFICTGAFAAAIERSAPVAVMDFGTRPGATVAEININNAEHTTSEYIITRLVNRSCFDVKDKDLVMGYLQEQHLNTVGLIDPDTAKCIGDALNTRYLLYGNVTNVNVSETGTQLDFKITGGVNICTVKAHIIARVMDVETGDIVMVAKGEGKSKSSFVKAGQKFAGTIKIGAAKVTQDSVHNAIQKAAYTAVDDLIFRLYGEDNKKWKIKM